MSWTELDTYARPVIDAFALVGAWIALVTFRRNVKIKRAEWLSSLHSKFFEGPNYKRIRQILDYQTPELKQLESAVSTGEASELVELFVDYLNFFEFVASLWKLGQLKLEEIDGLFAYYLANLNGHGFAVRFVSAQGFENLMAMQSALARRKGKVLT